MDSLSVERLGELLSGPHQAVLSVGRPDKGPIAVPMSYLFESDRFFMVTSPSSVHGRAMKRTGRATLTIQYERCDGPTVYQWYVMAEGRVAFTDADPAPLTRSILAKDRGERYADEWSTGAPPVNVTVAELMPQRLSGYEFNDSLDTSRP
jgi:nitroimidazol reductase NimA-like FMN-containing flavoprotein (pyridoxamine 5'-phosphate oxidase superfamily)